MRTNARQSFLASSLAPPFLAGTCLVVSGLVAAAPLYAQNAGRPAGVVQSLTDARWQPWIGCWDLLRDTVHESDPAGSGEAFPRGGGRSTAGAESRVCIRPTADGAGVRMRVEVQGEPVLEETIVADGTRRPIDDDQTCRGWRQDEWSADGRRLFGRAELTCADGPPQQVSHIGFITDPGSWLDIQGTTTGAGQAVRVRRYRRVGAGTADAGRPPLTSGVFDVGAVIEASRHVDALVLQAALVETQARFALDSRTMIALQEAGLPGDVTDLMVALTYPNRFRVTRVQPRGGPAAIDDWALYDWTWAAFTYSDWGYGGGWWWFPPDVIVGDPGGGGGGPQEGHGRVVNNLGYTRIETVGGSQARARGASTSTSSTSGDSSSSSSSGSSGSSGVSSSGYSSGGADGGGRTAVPR
jgi:hypothetical protein